MNDFLMDFMKFVGWQIKRFLQKDKDGWRGADGIYEHEYAKRAAKNIKKGDYVDAANLCFLAAWAKARREGQMPEFSLETDKSLISLYEDGKHPINVDDYIKELIARNKDLLANYNFYVSKFHESNEFFYAISQIFNRTGIVVNKERYGRFIAAVKPFASMKKAFDSGQLTDWHITDEQLEIIYDYLGED